MRKIVQQFIAVAALALAFVLSSGVRPALASSPCDNIRLPSGGGFGWSDDWRAYAAPIQDAKDRSEVGCFRLTDNGDGTTTVEIVLDANARQGNLWGKDSVHEGTYENYKAESLVRLNDLVDGASTTMITIPLKELGSKDHVIIIEDDSGVVAFGNTWGTG